MASDSWAHAVNGDDDGYGTGFGLWFSSCPYIFLIGIGPFPYTPLAVMFFFLFLSLYGSAYLSLSSES
jgi:hypothetical protein